MLIVGSTTEGGTKDGQDALIWTNPPASAFENRPLDSLWPSLPCRDAVSLPTRGRPAQVADSARLGMKPTDWAAGHRLPFRYALS